MQQKVPCPGVFYTLPPSTLQQLLGPAAGRAAVGKSASSTSCSPFPIRAVLLCLCCWEQPSQCGHPARSRCGWPGWCSWQCSRYWRPRLCSGPALTASPDSSQLQPAPPTLCQLLLGLTGDEHKRHLPFGEAGCAWCPALLQVLAGFFLSWQDSSPPVRQEREMGWDWTHLQRSHRIAEQSLGNASFLSSLVKGA